MYQEKGQPELSTWQNLYSFIHLKRKTFKYLYYIYHQQIYLYNVNILHQCKTPSKKSECGNVFQYKLRNINSWPTPEKNWKYGTVS